jgi:hypothetical protein
MEDHFTCSESISIWGVPLIVIAIAIGILYWGTKGGFVFSSNNIIIILGSGAIVIILYWIGMFRGRK